MSKELILTAGITNSVLTKPAKVFFTIDFTDNNKIETVYSIFENLNIPIKRIDNNFTQSAFFITDNDVDSKTIKMIWKNFRLLRPKIYSQWRYIFWEIDNQDTDSLYHVLAVFEILKLPVYVHKTFRGYHFLCIKPVELSVFQWATENLKITNPKYPPLTLRILPNKYPNESFSDGFIVESKIHNDTHELKKLVETQDISALQQKYAIVWYYIPDQKDLDEMSFEERLDFEQEQIDNERMLNS